MSGNPCVDALAGTPVQVTFTKPHSSPVVKVLAGTAKLKNAEAAGWMTLDNLALLDIAPVTPLGASSLKVKAEGSFLVYAGIAVHLISDTGYTATLAPAVPPASKVTIG